MSLAPSVLLPGALSPLSMELSSSTLGLLSPASSMASSSNSSSSWSSCDFLCVTHGVLHHSGHSFLPLSSKTQTKHCRTSHSLCMTKFSCLLINRYRKPAPLTSTRSTSTTRSLFGGRTKPPNASPKA